MRAQRIALHLTNTQTTLIGTTTGGLVCAHLTTTGASTIHLILRQVAQTHKVQRAHVDIRLNLLSCDTRIQDIVALSVYTDLLQNITQLCYEVPVIAECCCIELRRQLCTRAPRYHLHELCDCHTRDKATRIHHHIRYQAIRSTGHIRS